MIQHVLRTVSLIVAILVPAAGHAADGGVTVVPIAGRGDVRGPDARGVLSSERAGVGIAVFAVPNSNLTPGGRLEIAIMVDNRDVDPLAFGPDDVSATSGGRAWPVHGAEELKRQVQAQVVRLRNEASAERSRHYATLPPTYSSSSLSTAGASNAPASSASSSGPAGDSLAPSGEERRRVDDALDDFRKRIDDWERDTLAMIAAMGLQGGTIAPGSNAYGHVVVELPTQISGATPFALRVAVAGSTFEFPFEVRPLP